MPNQFLKLKIVNVIEEEEQHVNFMEQDNDYCTGQNDHDYSNNSNIGQFNFNNTGQVDSINAGQGTNRETLGQIDEFKPPLKWKRITAVMMVPAGHSDAEIINAACCSGKMVRAIRQELEARAKPEFLPGEGGF